MLAKLVGAMRLQDEATTLRGILEALARGASGEAARVAVLLVDGEHAPRLRGLRVSRRRPPEPIRHSTVIASIAAVVRDRQRLVLAAPQGARLPDVPPFMRAMSGNSGIVVPVIVGELRRGRAVRRGARERSPARRRTSVWMEHVEVLVRHASSRLENVTSRRTVEVLTSTH